MRRGFEKALLAVAALAVMAGSADALLVSLDRGATRRALELAQWPRTDQDRARFHARYVVRVGSAPLHQTSVDTIETITEFRRMVIIAEEHARLNDMFARGGRIQEAEEALRAYRGRLSIVAHLRFGPHVAGVPDIDLAFADPDAPRAIDLRRADREAARARDPRHQPARRPDRRPRHHPVSRRSDAARGRTAAAHPEDRDPLLDRRQEDPARRRRAVHGAHDSGGARCADRFRPAEGDSARRARRPRSPRAADQGRLRRQERADVADPERAGAPDRGGRPLRSGAHRVMKKDLLGIGDLTEDEIHLVLDTAEEILL